MGLLHASVKPRHWVTLRVTA